MVVKVEAAPTSQRVMRRPQHTHNIRAKPFVIQPFMIAPVLPGETMKNLLLQSRVVTDPVKDPLVGWWIEYYYFYIKHRDLQKPLLEQMVLDPETDVSSLKDATGYDALYRYPYSMNFVSYCKERVVEEYFRDEGQGASFGLGIWSGVGHVAAINGNGWYDSIHEAEDLPTGGVVSDDDPVASVDKALETYEYLLAQKLINMSYEDFLRSYGVRSSRVQLNRPELIRYVRDWQYPSNTVNPVDGTVASAVSWSVTERADKDRFFTEPGFIFGVTVARPKVYLGGQRGAAVGAMDSGLSWLPAIMREEVYTSLKQQADGTGPWGLDAGTEGYWFDIRDLLLYGDQFLNHTPSAFASAMASLPRKERANYPVETEIDALFSGPGKFVRQDGITTLNILGTQTDHT